LTPGPYSICHSHLSSDDTDAPTLTTLRFGYDTAAKAYKALPNVAKEQGVASVECIVIRVIEKGEAGAFFQ
jgi:hypothetical protein